jgi:hypothetical protein
MRVGVALRGLSCGDRPRLQKCLQTLQDGRLIEQLNPSVNSQEVPWQVGGVAN